VLVVASTALFAYGTASSGSNGGHDTATSRALEPSIGHDPLMYSASAAQICEAFTAAGMAASDDPHGLVGRGLYVASIAA